jgi:hypothetical protein
MMDGIANGLSQSNTGINLLNIHNYFIGYFVKSMKKFIAEI